MKPSKPHIVRAFRWAKDAWAWICITNMGCSNERFGWGDTPQAAYAQWARR